MTKLLIVDDNDQNRYLLQVLLQGHGYEVTTALDGNEALETARSDPPDMLITDILMPGMDGFTLCRHWKADEELQEIPFVFYTATYTDPQDEEFALSLGAARFILKPAEPDALLAVIVEALEAQETNQLVAPQEPIEEEAVYYKKYNQALIHKLEDKLVQLEGANKEIRRQRDRLQSLHRIDKAISGILELDKLLDQLAKELTAVLNMNRCSIWLLDESGKFLRGRGYGLKADEPPSEIHLPLNDPLAARLFQTGQSLVVSDVNDPVFADVLNEEFIAAFHVHAFLATPLIYHDRVTGFFVLDDTRTPRPFLPEEIQLVESTAVQAAIVIENARLFATRRQSEARYHAIFEGVRDAIFVEGLSGEILDVNQAACDMHGWSREEMLTKTIPELVPPGQKALMADELIGQSSSNHPLETINLRANGAHFPVEIHGGLQTIDDETVMLVVVRDITERKRAEAQLRLQSAALEAAANAIMITDRAGVIQWINPAFTRLTGYTAAETIGQNARILSSGKQDKAFYASLWRTILNGEVWQGLFINQHKDGALFYDEQIITPLLDEHGTISHFIAIQEDITPRKQAEEALQRYAARLEALHTIDQEILALQAPDAVAQVALNHLRQLIPCQQAIVATFDKETAMATILAVAGQGMPNIGAGGQMPLSLFGGLDNLQKVGTTRLVEDMSMVAQPSPGVKILLEQGLHAGIYTPLITKGELIGALALAAPEPRALTAEHVEIAQEVASQLAVAIQSRWLFEQTQQHAAELEARVAERTQELAEANKRLTELDRLKSKFVSDVSHELRTPITNLSLYLDLIEHSKPEMRARYTAVLRQETNRLRQLVEDILNLSRLEMGRTKEPKFEMVDLNEVVAQMVMNHHPRAGAAGLNLSSTLAPSLPLIWGERNQLAQVVTNLMSNAIRYTPSGSIHISTYVLPDRQQVCLQVEDSGIGIAANDMAYLFDRFYRGQQMAQSDIPGTGLGLAILKEIVDLHDGDIEVASQLEKGSVFRVLLPIAQDHKSG